ncbi:MAG: TM2 domain-containing protein [Crocinitomicaceae bacterium]|nr:TM2 domain-containing protein [Crocinitomicaceae bacterium]
MYSLKRYLLKILMAFLVVFIVKAPASASASLPFPTEIMSLREEIHEVGLGTPDSIPQDRIEKKENTRVVAAVLCAALGLFGVHRMYLGTNVRVPVFYTLTIGGGVALWIADLGLIIFSKNIVRYIDNPNVFMWKEK